jgi:hypothetical protein
MILNTRQIYMLRMGQPKTPANFGGDSKSETKTTTQNYDNRVVETNTTSNLDLSNRSTNNTNITTNNLDGGAIGAMKEVALNGLAYGDSLFDTATLFANNALKSSLGAAESAYSTASGLQKDALLGARDAFASATKAASDAYKNSDASTKTAYATALDGAAAAYADAKGTTNSQKSIIMGVIAVAGIMALSLMQKRGA